jgi:hypothetical protein
MNPDVRRLPIRSRGGLHQKIRHDGDDAVVLVSVVSKKGVQAVIRCRTKEHLDISCLSRQSRINTGVVPIYRLF